MAERGGASWRRRAQRGGAMSEIQIPATAPVEPLPGGPSTAIEREFTIKERKQWHMVLTRFLRHRLAVASLIVLILVILMAYVVPLFWKYAFTDVSSPGSSPPTLNSPLGTDQIGHDLFAQVMRGTQQSLKVAFIVAAAILAESALSFVGIVVQAPDISLGVLVNAARTAVDTRPWLFYFPGLVIIIIALTVNFVGDGLRDAFDPRQTRQRR